MNVGTILMGLVFPILLLAGSILRINIVSFSYFILFILSMFSIPHSIIRRRVNISRALSIIACVISFVSIIFHAIFQFNIIVHWENDSPRKLLFIKNFIGFERINGNVGKGFLIFTPHIVIFLYTSIIQVLFIKKKILKKVEDSLSLPKEYPLILSLLIIFMVGLSGVTYASVLQLIYYFIFCLMITLYGFFRMDIVPIVKIISPFIVFYSIIHMIINYLYQIKYINEEIIFPYNLKSIIGLHYWNDKDDVVPLKKGAIITSWILSLLLFSLLNFIRYKKSLKQNIFLTHVITNNEKSDNNKKGDEILTNDENDDEEENDYDDGIYNIDDKKIKSKKSLLRRISSFIISFIKSQLWRICIIALLAISLSLPSLMSTILLFIVCMASILKKSILERGYVIFLTTLYLFLYTSLLYLYNIPITNISYKNRQLMESIGLRRFDNTWFEIGLLSLSCVLLSINHKYLKSEKKLQGIILSVNVKYKKPKSTYLTVDNIISSTTSDENEEIEEEGDDGSEKKSSLRIKHHLKGLPSVDFISSKDLSSTDHEDDEDDDEDDEDDDNGKDHEIKTPWYKRFISEASIEKTKTTFRVFGMWLLSQTYFFALIGVFITSLQSITLFNTVYMIIFILFLGWSKANKAWILLVLYCEAVVLILYCWHSLIWTRKYDDKEIIKVIGLKHYSTSKELFTEGLLWHLVIMLFSVTQLWIIRYYDKVSSSHSYDDQINIDGNNNENIKKRMKETPRWIKITSNCFYSLWYHYGLIPVYVSLILVSTLYELSIINILYLLFTFTCFVIHMRSKRALTHIKRFWVFVVIGSAVILLSRYAFQFKYISELLGCYGEEGDTCEIFYHIGLFKFKQGNIFIPLLGNSIVYVIVVIQLRTFFNTSDDSKMNVIDIIIEELNKNKKKDDEEIYIPLFIRMIKQFIDFIKRLFMLHSYKICIFVIFIVCLSPINVLNMFFLNIGLISLILPYGTDHVGSIILLYSQIISILSMIYQFEKVHNNYYRLIFTSIGFYVNNNRFNLIFGYISIMVFLLIQRYSRRLYNDEITRIGSESDITLFLFEKDIKKDEEEGREGDNDNKKKFSFYEFFNGLKWFLSNFMTICSYQLLCFGLLILSLVRYDTIISIISFIILGLSVRTKSYHWKNNTKTIRFILFLLSILTFLQYFMNMKFISDNLPLKNHPQWRKYLGLFIPNQKVLLTDLFVCLIISRIRYINVKSIYRTNYYKTLVSSPLYEDFKRPRSWQNSVRYIIFRFSLFVILLLIFIAGSIQADIMSLGYVFFSLFFIFRESSLYGERNRLWRWARLYNYIVLLVIIAYQVPIYFGGYGDDRKQWVKNIESIIGVEKLKSPSPLLFGVFIFILLSIQKRLFERREFDNVVKYILEEEEKGIRIAYRRFQEWKMKRKEEFEIVQAEKLRRKNQLNSLKEARHRQQKLWVQMGAIDRGESLYKGQSFLGYQMMIQKEEEKKKIDEQLLIKDDEKEEEEEQQQKDDEEIVVHVYRRDKKKDEEDIIIDDEESEEDDESDDEEDDESDDEEDENKSSSSKCCKCKTPKFIITATDFIIDFLDKYGYGELHLKTHYSRPKKILAGIYGLLRQHSDILCYVVFIINATVNSNILSLLLPLSMFGYALIETPRPHKLYWNLIFIYTMMVSVTKILFQMNMFVPCESKWVFIGSSCPPQKIYPNYPKIIGLETLERRKDFILSILSDIFVLIVIFMHRHWLKKNGYWSFFVRLTFKGSSDPMDEKNLRREARLLETIVLRQQKKREYWMKYESLRKKKKIRQIREKMKHGIIEDDDERTIELGQVEQSLIGEVFDNPIYGDRSIEMFYQDDEQKKHDKIKINLEDEDEDEDDVIIEDDKRIDDDKSKEKKESEDQKKKKVQYHHHHHHHDDSNIKDKAKSFFRRVYNKIIDFYKDVFANKPGKDFYVVIWFIELISFIYILLLPSPFVGGSNTNVADFLTESRLPNSYVLILLSQFILIIIDRIIYLYRAIKVKLILQYILSIFYHIWIWILLPFSSRSEFSSLKTLIVFYLIKVLYLYFSGLQIMYGYPAFVQGQFLTDSKDPSMFRSLVYTAYRAIPFVYELRTLLDWTVTKTSLTFFEFLKLEDIYANLFQVKCRVMNDKKTERNIGDPTPGYIKFLMGAAFFFALCAIIWFPLLLLMQGSPGNQLNPVNEAKLSFGFTGRGENIYSSVAINDYDINDIPYDRFELLRSNNTKLNYDDYKNIQSITLSNFSDHEWMVSDVFMEKMIDLIKDAIDNNKSIPFTSMISFKKVHFLQNLPLYSDYINTLNIDNNDGLLDDILLSLQSPIHNFTIKSALPRFFRLPTQGNPVPLSPDIFSIDITFKRSINNHLLWHAYPLDDIFHEGLFNDSKIEFITVSSEIPTGVFRSIATGGIIGLYIGVVLAVARFLRMSVTDLAVKIIYEDMPSCSELITYCEDIFLARQDGDLVLEEELYRELIELYRSPERLIQKTLPDGPRFKGRPLTEEELKKKNQ